MLIFIIVTAVLILGISAWLSLWQREDVSEPPMLEKTIGQERDNSARLIEEHTAVQQLIRLVLTTQDPEADHDDLAGALAEGFRFPFAWIDLLDRGPGGAATLRDPGESGPHRPPIDAKFSREVIAVGKTLYFEDISKEAPDRFPALIALGVHTMLAMPLGAADQGWGALILADREVRNLPSDTILNLKLVADCYSLAVESHRDQEMLEQTEARSRAIINTATDGIITISDSGVITSVNPAFEDIFGYIADEVIGLNVNMLMPDPYHSEHDQYLANYLQTGQRKIIGVTRELVGKRKDGHVFPIELTVSELPMGELRMYTGVVRDITKRKNRLRELQDARLVAENATVTKSRFLADMGHRVRTPMNSILGMSTLLTQTEMPDEQQEYVNSVHEAAESLADIMDDILDSSRLENGKLELEYSEFDPRTPLESVGDQIAESAQSQGIDFILHIDHKLPAKVKGDSGRLRQVLLNLLKNALRHTEQGRVMLRVSLKDRQAGGVQIIFEVIDSGIGIPDNLKDRVFMPFSNSDGSPRRPGGTGLSLYLSKSLVQLMGGNLRFQSQEGKGAHFFFTLPFTTKNPLPAEAPLRLEPYRCLIVQEDDDKNKAIEAILRPTGVKLARLRATRNLLDALDKASRESKAFHWVILPFDSSDATKDIIRNLKKSERLSDIGVILTASAESHHDALPLMSEGAAYCLCEPVRRAPLWEAMAGCVGLMVPWPETTPEVTPRQNEKHRILIVEDNPVNRNVAWRLLQKRGYQWALAQNGKEATEMFQKDGFDLILMDCQMPVMDGYEATRLIREHEPASQRAPIIAMTAGALKSDREKCISAGMDDYLAKPVRAADLYNLLDKYLPQN